MRTLNLLYHVAFGHMSNSVIKLNSSSDIFLEHYKSRGLALAPLRSLNKG